MKTFTCISLFIVFCFCGPGSNASDVAARKVLSETLKALNLARIPENGLYRTALSLESQTVTDEASLQATAIGLLGEVISWKMGKITRGEVINRWSATLQTLLENQYLQASRVAGYFKSAYSAKGENISWIGYDTNDNGILMICLIWGSHNIGDSQITSLVTRLYTQINWTLASAGKDGVYQRINEKGTGVSYYPGFSEYSVVAALSAKAAGPNGFFNNKAFDTFFPSKMTANPYYYQGIKLISDASARALSSCIPQLAWFFTFDLRQELTPVIRNYQKADSIWFSLNSSGRKWEYGCGMGYNQYGNTIDKINNNPDLIVSPSVVSGFAIFNSVSYNYIDSMLYYKRGRYRIPGTNDSVLYRYSTLKGNFAQQIYLKDLAGQILGLAFKVVPDFNFSYNIPDLIHPNAVGYKFYNLKGLTDIEINPQDSSLFLIKSDSLYLLRNGVMQHFPVADKIWDISATPSSLYISCQSHIYKFSHPIQKNQNPIVLLTWGWDPTVYIVAKPGGLTGDFVTYYIANWGSFSGVILQYPKGIIRRLTGGGASFGLFDIEKDFLYYGDQVSSKRLNLADSSTTTLNQYVSSSFLLNGKSFLLSSINKFSTDYGLTWTDTQKPLEVSYLTYDPGLVRLNSKYVAWGDDWSDKLMLIDSNGKIYPTTVRVPDGFRMKAVIRNTVWGITAGDLVSIDISGYKIENYISATPLQQTLTILPSGDKPQQKITFQARYGKTLFKSSDESIATVNAQGIVTAKRTGLVTITSYVPALGDTAYAEKQSVICINSTNNQEVRICDGESYNGWKTPGGYVQKFVVRGADSTVYTTLFVNSLPSKPGNISGASTVSRGNRIQYWVSIVPNAASYAWELPSGASGTSTTNSILVTFSETARSGAVSVKALNSCGASPASVFPILITGTDLIRKETLLKIYPNPVTDILWIDASLKGKLAEVEIIDQMGRTVYRESVTQDKWPINISKFPTGYYILRISGNSGVRNAGFLKNKN